MGKVISINQIKGGAGKTTTAVNLCGALNEMKYKSCLLDMDIEKPDALRWASQHNENENISIDFVYQLEKDNTQKQIASLKDKYDYVILDTPPNNNEESFKAILSADVIILPCAPSPLDQFNIEIAIELPTMSCKPFYLLATRVDKREKLSKDLLEQLKISGQSLDTFISKKVDIVTSVLYGKWVGQYANNCESHVEFKNLAKEIINKISK